MAKVTFSKLGLTKSNETFTINWKDQEIEVKQYLPISDKLELIAAVINQSQDSNNFMNPAKVHVFTCLEIIFRYTNISFTEKQKEDIPKLYDLMESSGLIQKIIDIIPGEEYKRIVSWVNESCDNVYKYRNSIYGILDAMSTDYKDLELDAEKIRQQIGDGENVEFLKEVLTKMG